MSKQQKNSAFVKMLKEFPKVFGRVSFRERLMLRTAFDYINEEVIADIKANCDLAIEGRDVKIKELEQEIVNLNSTLDLRKMQLDDSAEIIKEMQSNVDTLQKKNAELKEKLNFSTQYYRGEKAKALLAKAKELINLFVQWNYGCCKTPDFKDLVKQAEQFIKGLEK